MDDGGGTIGGGSVYVKFHVGPEKAPTSEVELNDNSLKDKTVTLTFRFPATVDMSKAVRGQVVTVTTDQLKKDPIKIDWDNAAGQTLGASA